MKLEPTKDPLVWDLYFDTDSEHNEFKTQVKEWSKKKRFSWKQGNAYINYILKKAIKEDLVLDER